MLLAIMLTAKFPKKAKSLKFDGFVKKRSDFSWRREEFPSCTCPMQ
jgi:hypothetical protein